MQRFCKFSQKFFLIWGIHYKNNKDAVVAWRFPGGDSPFAGRVGRLPLSDFSCGIAAATYAKNMPPAYFLNAAAPRPGLLSPRRESNQRDAKGERDFDFPLPLRFPSPPSNPHSLKRLFKGATGPLARGATPQQAWKCTASQGDRSAPPLARGATPQQAWKCAASQGDRSAPPRRGGFRGLPPPIPPQPSEGAKNIPLQKATRPWGENQIVYDENRLPCGHRNGESAPLPRFLSCSQALKSARGVAPLARGRSPLEDVVAGGVSKEGDTIESVPLFCAPLVTFPARGK